MPYLKQSDRWYRWDRDDPSTFPATPGELNYMISMICSHYRINSYQDLNDVIGALEGAKLEFYRRVVVPYEDQKIFDNGDVYE